MSEGEGLDGKITNRWPDGATANSSARIFPRALAAALVVLFWAAQAAAQELKTQIRRQEQQQEEQQKTGAAARDAEQQKLVEGEDVSFTDVLANPDDVDLNFRYAKTQIRLGEVRAAAATLERILLIDPNLPRVRLLYAVVLFRLDSMDEAEREIRLVLDQNMSAGLRATLVRYLADIERRRRRTRYSVLANISGQWDWNRNQSPVSKQVNTIAGRAFLSPDAGRRSDGSLQGFTRFDVEHDLGFQERHRIFGAVSYYHSAQKQLNQLDLQSLNAEVGGVVDLNPVTVTLNALRRNIRLSHQRFINTTGGGGRIDYRWRPDLNLYAAIHGEAQTYYELHESRRADLQAGPEYRATLGVRHIIDPTMQISGDYTRLRKEARAEFDEYASDILALNHTWLMGKGVFLLTHGSLRIDQYDGPDPLVASRARRDAQYRLRLTLGVPLEVALFGVELPELLQGFTVALTGEVFRSASNITNFTYWNRRVAVGISKRWEF